MKPGLTAGALSGYRVLDLTDEKGVFCPRILAGLGAEVIKVERPGGDPLRSLGPFYHDVPHPERSLYWFTLSAGKKSVTLNIQCQEGQGLLKRLAATADFVIESFPPGYLTSLGLDYAALSQVNQSLIVTSVTPFGQSGPYRHWKAPDLVALAVGGFLNVCGDADRPPVRMITPQAYLMAGSQAALGSLIAHWHRRRTGEGQHVDVSVQEAVTMAMESGQLYWEMLGVAVSRMGSYQRVGNRIVRCVYPCKDGFVASWPDLHGTLNLMGKWMASEGLPDALAGPQWKDRTFSPGPGQYTQEEIDCAESLCADLFLRHTKAELYEGGQLRDIVIFPVSTVKEVLESQQLKARGYFVELEHPELGQGLVYAGAPFKMGQSPWQPGPRAPLIGEHNEAIYGGDLGISRRRLGALQKRGVI